MSIEKRPSPDELLEAIYREEKEKKKGQLKIFLGMAAGVGKTFAMLEEAQQLVRQGIDLVVGIVETHGRQETGALLKGLEIIPPQKITYKDKEFDELNLDAILKRRPQIALVDELAHSNIPGARHPKRWQDVKELLDNGIDVYTTLNIQHVDSLNEVIQDIATIAVKETVPDSIIQSAKFIQLVDLSPDELLERLKEGKVYLGEQAEVALEYFFKKDRLTALREISLRFTAEKVDHDLSKMVSSVERSNGWKPREKLLVGVSSSPHSQKLIRTTRRLAFNMNASWIALYVNDNTALNEIETQNLSKNLALARELGAEVLTTNDTDIAKGIARIAEQKGVTQIIVGRPPERRFFDLFKQFTIVDDLVKECKNIDIHVIKQEKLITRYRSKLMAYSSENQFFPYIFVTLWVLGLSILMIFLNEYIHYHVVGVVFLLGILLLSLFVRKGPIFFASILFALIWDYFFSPPIGSFHISSPDDVALIILYFLTAIITGILVDRAREQREILVKREGFIQALYEMMTSIAHSSSKEKVSQELRTHLAKFLPGIFEILIATPEGTLNIKPSPLLNNEKEISGAHWSFKNNNEAGWSTTSLPNLRNFYIPLQGSKNTVGILIFKPDNPNRPLTSEETNLLHVISQQLSYFLERTLEEEKIKTLEQSQQQEKIYEKVFSYLSEELKLPLSSMQEAIHETLKDLRTNSTATPSKVSRKIYKLEDSSRGLKHLFEGISTMASLSGGRIPLEKGKLNIKDVLEACYNKYKKNLENRQIKIIVQDDLPLVTIDFSLMEILIHHLLNNALRYSPPDSTIQVEAKKEGEYLALSVADEGEGISPERIVNLNQFFQSTVANIPGIGLGLSMVKKIAEIHNGSVKVENRPEKGAQFIVYIPLV